MMYLAIDEKHVPEFIYLVNALHTVHGTLSMSPTMLLYDMTQIE